MICNLKNSSVSSLMHVIQDSASAGRLVILYSSFPSTSLTFGVRKNDIFSLPGIKNSAGLYR
jgi:hypothetical protein